MKSKASNPISKIVIIVLTVSSVILVSCSDKACPAYAKPLERIQSSDTENINPKKTNTIQSPYTEKYKSKLLSKFSVIE
jgi:hypothetical protein